MDAWLPIGLELPDGAAARLVIHAGENWQICEANGGGRVLIVERALEERWIASGLIAEGQFNRFKFGMRELSEISSSKGQFLTPVSEAPGLQGKPDAMSFAASFRATLGIDPSCPLQDAIFVEKVSRLLPTFGNAAAMQPEAVAGFWLTGGIDVPVTSLEIMQRAIGWLPANDILEIAEACGFSVDHKALASKRSMQKPQSTSDSDSSVSEAESNFELAGRPALAAFFNEHVVDIIRNRERYAALGIGFPSAVILHGPPGCGKTFAVEQLIRFLGWPSFQIDASSVASPYIHETSKKVADVFEKAMSSSPSVLVIDEMEAFLADREIGSGHHRVEEVAEFLRRIPEAAENEVLIIAMTNRIDMIDAAILRRGRFDHVIDVGFANEVEVAGLLKALLKAVPCSEDVDTGPLAMALAGRPLSDVSFVVREGARLAARSGATTINQLNLMEALRGAGARNSDEQANKIGF